MLFFFLNDIIDKWEYFAQLHCIRAGLQFLLLFMDRVFKKQKGIVAIQFNGTA